MFTYFEGLLITVDSGGAIRPLEKDEYVYARDCVSLSEFAQKVIRVHLAKGITPDVGA